MVLRKVLTIVMTDDDETAPSGMNGYGAITLLKDIFVGTLFGLVTISFLIFLDRKFMRVLLILCTLIHLFISHDVSTCYNDVFVTIGCS